MSAESGSEHLLLIDGLNIVRRVYEANPVENSPAKAQGAVRSSLASFRRALAEHKPTHVLAPFDYGGHTWRHDLYAAYRQNRKPMPQELRDVLPELYEKLREMGVHTISIPGVEADDALAAVTYKWDIARRGPVTILSTDKDLAYLACVGAGIRDHFNLFWRDEAWIFLTFGVGAAKLHDLLAIAGDTSDGVPGVPGVGYKTAAKWLNLYGDLDGVLAHASEIKGKVGESLRASIELVRLARKLVAFKTDFPLGVTWNSIKCAPTSSA